MSKKILNQSSETIQDFDYSDFFSPKEAEDIFGDGDFIQPSSLEDAALEQKRAELQSAKKKEKTRTEKDTLVHRLVDDKETAKKTRARKSKKVQKKINEEIAETIQELTGIEIPEKADPVEVASHIEEVKDIITELSPDDIEIKTLNKIDEFGYPREKISVSKDVVPSAFSKITKSLYKISGGAIPQRERTTEFRVIIHTNTTQLKNSDKKISPISVTYKPDQSKLKTNKGTRVILSIPQDNPKNVYIYLSEGRVHNIFEIEDYEKYTEWLAKMVWTFFTDGIEIASWKIKIREVDAPLMKVVDSVLSTGRYYASPHLDKNEKRIDYVSFLKKNTVNGWLRIVVKDVYPKFVVEGLTVSSRPGESAIMMIDLDDTGKQSYTLQDLEDYLVVKMDFLFDKKESEWMESMGYGANSIISNPKLVLNKLGIMKNKLTYRPLKVSIDRMMDIISQEIANGSKIGLKIFDIVDKNQVKKMAKAKNLAWKRSNVKGDVDAEAVVGETNKVEFILNYMYLFLPKYDKRKSSEFITSEKYYYNKQLQTKSTDMAKEYTGVKDRRPAIEREKSLAGRGEDRNYHSGAYVFVLEYNDKSTGRSYRYIAQSFDEILEETKFLSDHPKFNVKSKFDSFLK